MAAGFPASTEEMPLSRAYRYTLACLRYANLRGPTDMAMVSSNILDRKCI